MSAESRGIQTRYLDWAELGCLQQGTQVMCWGGNYHGGLGNNSLTDATVPVLVARQQ